MVYEKIESLYIIKGTIETVGTLYIGLGEKDELRDVELPFIRLSDGRVFIPASSIKGALRSSVERICKSLCCSLLVPKENKKYMKKNDFNRNGINS